MKVFWKSLDDVFGYARIFETATPWDRVLVAVHTGRAVVRIVCKRLRTAGEILVYRTLLRGKAIGLQSELIDGLTWHRVSDPAALRRVAAGQGMASADYFRATLWHFSEHGDDAMFVRLRQQRVVGAMIYRPSEPNPSDRAHHLFPHRMI